MRKKAFRSRDHQSRALEAGHCTAYAKNCKKASAVGKGQSGARQRGPTSSQVARSLESTASPWLSLGRRGETGTKGRTGVTGTGPGHSAAPGQSQVGTQGKVAGC